MSLGTLVGRALVRGGHAPALIEFDAEADKRLHRKQLRDAKSAIADVFTVSRVARDLYQRDYAPAPSAEVGNFKITPSSPNTARVTVGPDRRMRRKKYEWEKESFKHRVRQAVGVVGSVALVKAGGKLATKGGGSSVAAILRGAKLYGQEGADIAKNVGRHIFKGTAIPARYGSSVTEKAAAMYAKPAVAPRAEAERVIKMPGSELKVAGPTVGAAGEPTTPLTSKKKKGKP